MHYPIKYFPLTLLAGVAAGLASPTWAFPAGHSVPPASFLEYHVDTAPQLAFEVAYDRVVRLRLAHHFHLSGPAMSAYVRDNLALKHLSAPLRTRVYCISPRGREYFVVMMLKKGSAVFASRRTGEPILRLVCGNPLVRALPPSPKKVARAKPKRPAQTRVKSAKAEKLLSPAEAVKPLVGGGAAGPAIFALPGSSAVLFTAGGGGGGLGWLPFAGGLIALLSPHGGGHSGTSAPASGGPVPLAGLPVGPVMTGPGGPTPTAPLVPTAPIGPTPTSPVGPTPKTPIVVPPAGPLPMAVPEPNPVLVFLMGGLALGAWRLVRRRK